MVLRDGSELCRVLLLHGKSLLYDDFREICRRRHDTTFLDEYAFFLGLFFSWGKLFYMSFARYSEKICSNLLMRI